MKLRAWVLPVVVSLAGLAVGTALPGAAAAPLSNGTRLRASGASRAAGLPIAKSGNWSGYVHTAPTGTKLTFASATWTVPKVKSITGFASTWVGIDGATNQDLIQTGTDEFFLNGKAFYGAWWEILPAAETPIASLTVSPGDSISAFVWNLSATHWLIAITDTTTKQTFSIVKTYTGPGASAEWIQEAPSAGQGVLLLAHYGETGFRNVTVGTNFAKPQNPRLAYPSGAIALVQNGIRVSTPSKPTGGNSFNIAYGNKQPPAP